MEAMEAESSEWSPRSYVMYLVEFEGVSSEMSKAEALSKKTAGISAQPDSPEALAG
jgi:hypothetical protein